MNAQDGFITFRNVLGTAEQVEVVAGRDSIQFSKALISREIGDRNTQRLLIALEIPCWSTQGWIYHLIRFCCKWQQNGAWIHQKYLTLKNKTSKSLCSTAVLVQFCMVLPMETCNQSHLIWLPAWRRRCHRQVLWEPGNQRKTKITCLSSATKTNENVANIQVVSSNSNYYDDILSINHIKSDSRKVRVSPISPPPVAAAGRALSPAWVRQALARCRCQ